MFPEASRFAAGDDLLADRLDALLEDVIGFRTQPRLGQALLERIGAPEVAENDVELTDTSSNKLDLLIEESQHLRFDRAARGEVDDVRLARLADAVDAADALLHDHRVPGELVIHEAIAELQVQSLGAGARRYEDGVGVSALNAASSSRAPSSTTRRSRRSACCRDASRDRR